MQKNTRHMKHIILLFISLLSGIWLHAQTTAVVMTMQNVVQIAPNIFEYDIMLTNTGTTALALRGYSCGINHAAGMNGTGTITHSFISRDASLSTIPSVSATYTASLNHIRLTTVNASAGSEVPMTIGVPVRIATMRITNTTSFPVNFDPAFNMQTIPASGKTQCVATCIVTPPGSSFVLNGAGNNPTAGTLQVLTASVNAPCFYLNAAAAYAASVTAVNAVTCYGQSNGSLQVATSGTGSTSSGFYRVNGGTQISYATNPFSINNLPAGNYTITVSNANGCSDTALATITQPASGITTTSSLSVCNSYTWNGTTYTISGNYQQTYIAASGCDSVHTLQLTVRYSSTGSSSVTACNSYTWNGITYTASANPTFTYVNSQGCDSVHTLNLVIVGSSGSSTVNVCNSYIWNGVSYTTSGIYTHTYNGPGGCDSVHTLNLTIRYGSSSSSTQAVQNSYTWPANNVTYTNTGIYTLTLVNAVGCDSVLTLNLTVLSQSSAIVMTLQNVVQTAPNVFQYDLMLTNTGATGLALRGYSAGVTHATGMRNGGTLTHTFLSRDPLLAALPSVTPSYTASGNHLRLVTLTAASGLEVTLPPGVPIRIATMRASNSVNFPADFNPAFTMQILPATNRTQCIAVCIVTPSGISYSLNGAGNTPSGSSLQVLSTAINTPCLFLNPSAAFTGAVTGTSPVICFGQSTATAQITLSGTGSAAPSGTTGTYRVDGGTSQAYNTNPFNVGNLSAGTHTISVTTSGGCIANIPVTISQPSAPITGSSNMVSCNSYTWNGVTYTVSGNPTHTYTAANGCDSVHTLNLTINTSNTGSFSAIACSSYTWNGVTYTASGSPTHSYTNSNGCDSVVTLNLQINYPSSSSNNITAVDQYTWNANNVTYTNSGTYTATLTNAAGCDSVLTLQLTILKLTLITDQDISCHGNHDGTLFAHAVGGSGNFVYDIDGANTFTNVTGYFFNLGPGTHTVCAREASSMMVLCATSVVLEPDPLTATFTLDSIATCTNSNGQLSINITGGTANQQPYLTLWTNSNGDTLNNQQTNNFAVTVGNLPAGFYNVRIEDDRGCVSNVDTTILAAPCNDTLDLKLFLQGYYTGSSAMTPTLFNEGVGSNTGITDSIDVQLRDAVSPYALIDTKRVLLQTNGETQAIFNDQNGAYYIVVTHRNGLQTWSALPVSFNSSLIQYDFSTAANKAYGDNQVEVEPGIWALFSGDLNQDENIDLLDASILEVDINNFQFGYFATDINGDGNVDLLDSPMLETNINAFVFSSHP